MAASQHRKIGKSIKRHGVNISEKKKWRRKTNSGSASAAGISVSAASMAPYQRWRVATLARCACCAHRA